MADYVACNLQELNDKLVAVFQGVDMGPADAQTVVNSLLDAEKSHVESHGLIRLKAYVDRIVSGNINVHPKLELKMHGAIATLDGDNGIGQVVTSYATKKCIELAKKNGICAISIHNSNHFGTAGFYTNQMARAGCLGMSTTNAGPTVAPFGGMEPYLGTNPIAISYPAKKQIFCCDMATSTVARGKILVYERKGDAIPLGWAIDAEGKETTDASKAANGGVLLPLGGYKGYGLGMVAETLSVLISGAKLSCETVDMFHKDGGNADVGHFLCALDIAHFTNLEAFEERAQKWFENLKALRRRPGMEIQIPGEPEDKARAQITTTLKVLSKTMNIVNEYYAKYKK